MMKRRSPKKRSYQGRARTGKKTSPLLWLSGGILIGLFISYLFSAKHAAPTSTDLATIYAPKKPLKHAALKKPQSSSNANSHYDFYNLLSSQEKTDEAENHQHPLQVHIATLKNFIEADQLKAQLLLIGIDNVQISKIYNHDHLAYKITSGPYTDQEEARQVQQKLKNNHISFTLETKELNDV